MGQVKGKRTLMITVLRRGAGDSLIKTQREKERKGDSTGKEFTYILNQDKTHVTPKVTRKNGVKHR